MKFGFPSCCPPFSSPSKPASPPTDADALSHNASSSDPSKRAHTSIPGDANKGAKLHELVHPKPALRKGGPVTAQRSVIILPGMASSTCNALRLAGWKEDMLSDLSADITTMLEAIEGKDNKEKKTLIRAFKNKYQGVLKPVDFSDSKVPGLMKPLRDALDAYLAQLNSTTDLDLPASFSSESLEMDLAADTGPGFDAERTNAAYERIHEKYFGKWGAIFAAERQASGETALDSEEPDTVVKSKAVPTTDPALENQKSANKARKEMQGPNAQLRAWLKENNIRVARNSGIGNNCLIISLLQHATGNYDAPNFSAAAKYRQMIRGNHMLHSDDEDFMNIVGAINSDYKIDMNVLCIRADETGDPFFEADLDTGKNKVVIWNQGAHYEALVSG